MKNYVLDGVKFQIEYLFANFGIIIALFVVGFTIGYLFKKYISDSDFRKQINLRIKEKDETIMDLRYIIYDKLQEVKVEKKDYLFFKRLKEFFKKIKT